MTIDHESAVLSYKVYPGGPKALLAFHGFGQNNEAFHPLVTPLLDRYTVYSFDLFFHGDSRWKLQDKPLSKSMWSSLLKRFLTEHGIERFSLMAYSLGGKVAFATVETFCSQIDELLLLAPDGIYTNFWYNLATYPVAFRAYFKSMIVKPHRFFKILNALKRMRLVDKGVLKFASGQMNTTKKRYRVYYSWVVYKEFTFEAKRLTDLINRSDVSTHLWLGRYDKIITVDAIQPFIKEVKGLETHILTCGHNDIIIAAAQSLSNRSYF